MSKITIGNLSIDVIKKDIKNLHLGVYPPDGRVRIAAPLKTADDSVRLYAVSKLKWIKNQRKKFQEQERLPKREFISGESHYFQGKRYLLNVIEHHAPPRIEIKKKKYIDLYVRPETNRAKRQAIFNDWYRQYLKTEIPTLVEKWEKRLETEVIHFTVRKMKTKWGSCNPITRRILINLELAKKPPQCLEYIIVHEMIHFFERHHNDRFIRLLNQYLPGWRGIQKELNDFPLESWE